jgi:hypothetical protein
VHLGHELCQNSILKDSTSKNDGHLSPVAAYTRDAVRQAAMKSHCDHASIDAATLIRQ